jgi:hypothetical protein
MIGDDDPEDGYDATDPLPARLVVLERTVESVLARPGEPRAPLRRQNAHRLLDVVDAELHDLHELIVELRERLG